MAQMARNLEERQEFWKPVVPSRQEPLPAETAGQVCENCGTDFLMGSRFCHVCGADRNANLAGPPTTGIREWFEFASLRDAIGQTTGSLVALFLGVACLVAAAITGFLYTATTVLDWQAVQIWRIEWLLAALAVFAGGLLLKRAK
jgi:hypothetical protein